jgi:hypothetical protein
MFKFQAVLARTQPFLSRSVRNGATNPGSNAEKGSIIMQFAVFRTLLATCVVLVRWRVEDQVGSALFSYVKRTQIHPFV